MKNMKNTPLYLIIILNLQRVCFSLINVIKFLMENQQLCTETCALNIICTCQFYLILNSFFKKMLFASIKYYDYMRDTHSVKRMLLHYYYFFFHVMWFQV